MIKMPYNVVDGYDAELVDELVKVRHAFVSKLDRVYNLQDIAFMMVAYAIARKETIK